MEVKLVKFHYLLDFEYSWQKARRIHNEIPLLFKHHFLYLCERIWNKKSTHDDLRSARYSGD